MSLMLSPRVLQPFVQIHTPALCRVIEPMVLLTQLFRNLVEILVFKLIDALQAANVVFYMGLLLSFRNYRGSA